MNWSTMVVVAKTAVLAVADKLVATTRGRQMGTDNNQLRQWRAALVGRWRRNACTAALVLWCWWGGGKALVTVKDDGGSRCAI
jgi:hypothetical protein